MFEIQSLSVSAAKKNKTEFDPKNPRVPVTQKCLDADDYAAMLGAVLEGHLTSGKHTEEFERALAKQFSLRCASFVNSGSSANLLALAALMDETLGDARLRPGDEVVTCAAGFPTTVNPIVQLGMVPVFVDCELGTYNADPEQVSEACMRPKTRAVFLAHTLGNPFFFGRPTSGVEWLLSDCCDALGSTVYGNHVGGGSHMATCSFYPAHHITTIEGGAVLTDSPKLDVIVLSLRDWGRSCYCPTSKDNTCGKRFAWKNIGGLPDGYDHKHVVSRIGYNLKNNDVSAALGVSQLRKLPRFSEARKRNFAQLYAALEDLQDRLILPKATPGSEPCWFGFPITIKPPLERRNVVDYLESHGCSTRPIFAGNIARQPAYRNVKCEQIGNLANADTVMRQAFYCGVHPSLGEEAMAYLAKTIREAVMR